MNFFIRIYYFLHKCFYDIMYNVTLFISNVFFNDGSIKYHTAMIPIYLYLISEDVAKNEKIDFLIGRINTISGYRFNYSSHKIYFEKEILYPRINDRLRYFNRLVNNQ